MAGYRYYVISSEDGTVQATDDKNIAASYKDSEEHFVIDAKEGLWIMDESEDPIPELTKLLNGGPDEDEDEDEDYV